MYLHQILKQTASDRQLAAHDLRVLILGIGHPLRGDDAAGQLVARRLCAPALPPNWSAIEGGPAPENASGAIRRIAPHALIMVDAAQMGLLPGSIRWLDVNEAEAAGFSTHSLPLGGLAAYLQAEVGCEILLLGIQPQSMGFDDPLSRPVERAVGRLSATLRALSREFC